MEWLKEGYARQGKRKHSICSKRRVNGGGELTIIAESIKINNCRKQSPILGLMEGKEGNGGIRV